MSQYRFAIGDRVECNTGEWVAGTVVALDYAQPNWPPGKIAPYQVRLDDERLIFAPIDDAKVIRATLTEAPIDPEDIPDADKIPVTVVTGFLGAGKTTLVNYILKSNDHGKRIAVIENEFGAVNIDEDLVSANLRTKEDIISMDNGCVCCTVRGDLVRALCQLSERKDKLDAVIIETTGLADPAPVCFSFNTNATVASNFRVDGIVCLVDVMHISQHLDEEKADGAVNEAIQQVAFADRVLINKCDLASRDQINDIKERIHSLNGYAELIESEKSSVALDKVLGLSAFSLERCEDLVEWTEEPEEPAKEECKEPDCHEDHGHGHSHGQKDCKDAECKDDHGHGHGHGHKEKAEVCEETQSQRPQKRLKKHHDLSGVSSVGLTLEGDLDSEQFNAFMSNLLEKNSKDIYRSKGVVSLAGEGDCKFVFQGVHEQVVFSKSAATWGVGEPRINKMVFIGRNLNKEQLTKSFTACLVQP